MPVTCALDISAEMLEKAMENDASRSISWILGDGQTLPFRDEVFDCVYVTLVIHHIEDKITTLMEAHCSMRKGGRFVTLTNSHNRLRKSILRYFPDVITIDLARFPTLPQLKRAMEDAGFRDVYYHAVHHNEYTPTAEYLERVKQRHVSTLTLLSDEDFQRGYEVFRQRILVNFGDRVLRHSGFDFVEGRK